MSKLINFILTFEGCFVFKICVVYYHEFISNFIIVFDSSRLFAEYIFLYLLLFTLNYVFSFCYIIHWENHILANTSWTRLLPFVLCYVECTAKADIARIPIHRSASYTYLSWELSVHTRFTNT